MKKEKMLPNNSFVFVCTEMSSWLLNACSPRILPGKKITFILWRLVWSSLVWVAGNYSEFQTQLSF